MSERDIPVTEDELHAYVDGELPADRRAAVEDWLAAHPEDDARIASWRAIGESVRARYEAVADEPVPARLDIDRLARVPSRWMTAAAAAVVSAFVAGAAAGWLAHGATAAPQRDLAEAMSDEAAAAHRLYIGEVRHPIEVRADESHLIPWLSRRLGTALKAPDLSDFGLRLMGGRLLPGPEGPAAMFMYETASGERVTLYSTPLKTTAPSAFRVRESDKYASVRWVADNYGWVVSGPQDKERLKKLATVAYQQMESRNGR